MSLREVAAPTAIDTAVPAGVTLRNPLGLPIVRAAASHPAGIFVIPARDDEGERRVVLEATVGRERRAELDLSEPAARDLAARILATLDPTPHTSFQPTS